MDMKILTGDNSGVARALLAEACVAVKVMMAAGVWLPFSPFADWLGFNALPIAFGFTCRCVWWATRWWCRRRSGSTSAGPADGCETRMDVECGGMTPLWVFRCDMSPF